MTKAQEMLETAWNMRKVKSPVRVFHGPGEGTGEFEHVFIDHFDGHFWITHHLSDLNPETLVELRGFVSRRNAKSAVLQARYSEELSPVCTDFYGQIPETLVCEEAGLKFLLRFKDTRHPGLFLDHLPLRQWLFRNTKGLTVLNTFCYTGSLSVAACEGAATQVTSLDLSKATIDWARENWKLNSCLESKGDFIYGDFFEWMPKFIKKGRSFDCVIADPPSFSRGKKGTFSTKKNLNELFELCMNLVAPQGYLIVSINSQSVSREDFTAELKEAAGDCGFRYKIIQEIHLPETFPTLKGRPEDDYLKGFILART
jgi:23S rRNA (cytosine1962-C5)-methyltransferase